ncbi:hypothetical protein M758_1G233200 [Ceratodon purpureus]|nr:hypothetical protein M758_1G233200 [Ceratodon purpureus]
MSIPVLETITVQTQKKHLLAAKSLIPLTPSSKLDPSSPSSAIPQLRDRTTHTCNETTTWVTTSPPRSRASPATKQLAHDLTLLLLSSSSSTPTQSRCSTQTVPSTARTLTATISITFNTSRAPWTSGLNSRLQSHSSC